MEKSQNRKPFQALRDLFHPVDLTHGTCWRTILQFSLPVILSYLLQQVYTISDAAIVGQTLTAQEVAGVNDTTSLVFIFLQFAFGVSAGFCVITSCCVEQVAKGLKRFSILRFFHSLRSFLSLFLRRQIIACWAAEVKWRRDCKLHKLRHFNLKRGIQIDGMHK